MRFPRLWGAAAVCCASVASYAETNLSLSLVNPGSNTIKSGAKIAIEVQGTFNTRLSAASFLLAADGTVELKLLDRSAKPTEANGLTYVSHSSQNPFDDDLPLSLRSSPSREVLYDRDPGPAPGSASDGLPPGNGVLIERITLRPRGLGTVFLRLTEVAAAHTTTAPSGTLFDVAAIGSGVIEFTVIGGGPGDATGDGFITLADHATLPGCITGPDGGPSTKACAVFGFDEDTDVDMRDVAEYQSEFGPPT